MCWRLTLEGLVLSLGLAVLLEVMGDQERTDLSLTMVEFAVVALLVAPVVETLLFQALPISVLRRLRAPLWLQVALSTVLFASLHLTSGIATALAAGAIGGFYLAWGYAHTARKSFWPALWTTSVQHFLRNTALFLIMACAGYFSWTGLEEDVINYSDPAGRWAVNYYYTPKGDFKFAFVDSGFNGRSGISFTGGPMDQDGNSLIPPQFTITRGGADHRCRYLERQDTIQIDGQAYDLTKGNILLLSPRGPKDMRIDQRMPRFDYPKGTVSDRRDALRDAVLRSVGQPVNHGTTSDPSTQPSGRD
jgi:hypothetical protein